jgi:uroporphyrinogen III methyltransferase/synthase
MAGSRVLLPRAQEARDVLPDRLREMGAVVEIVPAYRTVRDAGAAEEIVTEIQAGAVHAVTFTSSSTVRNFVESVGSDRGADLLRGVCVASIGPITSATARDLGIEPDVEAAEHTIPGLVEALTRWMAGAG